MPPESTPRPSLSTQVSRAVIWNTLFVPLRLVAEVLSTLVKINQLSQAGFGLVSLVRGASNLFGTGIDLGTARSLPKYIPEQDHAGGARAVLRLLVAVFALQMAVLLLVALGLALAQPQIGSYLQGLLSSNTRVEAEARAELSLFVADYTWLIVLVVLALLFLGTCYDMLMAFLSSFFRQKAWNSIALAAGLLPQFLTVAAILALPASLDILGVLGAMVLAPAIAVALAAWQVLGAQRDEQGQPIRLVDEVRTTLRDLRAALPPGFVRYSAVSYLMTVTDFVASFEFVNFFSQDIQGVALLSAGALLVRMALGYLYTPMVGVQVPLFTRVRQGEGGTLNGAYQSLVRLQLLLLVPGGVGLMLLAEPALLVLNPAYLPAAPIVWVLVPCLFLECLLTTAHNALIVHERLGTIIISRLITLLVVVPLAILLPPWAGLVGMALAFGVARLASGFWVTASGVRLLGLHWPWRFSLRVVLASAAMALIILGVRSLMPPLPTDVTLADKLREAVLMLGMAGIGAVAFFAALRLLGGIDAQDKAQLAKTKLPLKKWLLRVL
ncbi:polysaccharide biosynthesis C-terminal domain-containing protein [Candidatus Oscillochloris fontis]|uniref:polysaccharide biosynthesis C-terminal domain-containing protein n=1 Tax=Candidatus Oscillochloris fontis TaxID=2496868 RepID=UPI00101C0214|nr:polysaccharide biosynthesis C-terminal domain-containing protein [Candidatus Oscillochloris fontis]